MLYTYVSETGAEKKKSHKESCILRFQNTPDTNSHKLHAFFSPSRDSHTQKSFSLHVPEDNAMELKKRGSNFLWRAIFIVCDSSDVAMNLERPYHS